jgi:uncharacterized membrane protein
MKHLLQGRWLGHPLHAVLVHLPTAVWPAALICDLLTVGGYESNALIQAAFFAIALGLAFALLAVPTGLADWIDIKRENPAWKLGLAHMILNLIGAGLWALNLALRLDTFTTAAAVPAELLLLSLAGTALLAISSVLGGRMVFHHGISVARVSKERWRKIAQAGGAQVLPE